MSIQIDVITYEISVDFISENEIVVSLIDGISVYQNGTRKATGIRSINVIDGTNTSVAVDQYEGKARVQINSTASGGAWGGITGTLSDQTDLQSALNAKQNSLGYTAEDSANKVSTIAASATQYPNNNAVIAYAKPVSIVVSSNQTAANDFEYHVTASATFTDPTGVEGKGYTVIVRSGTATVGSVAYPIAGTVIRRIYHSAAWASYTGSHTILYKNTNIASSVTGTVSETNLTPGNGILIPGNTIQAGDLLVIYSAITRTGSGGNNTYQFYFNTSAAISGAARFASLTGPTSNNWAATERKISFISQSSQYGLSNSASNFITESTALARASFTQNFANDQYIIVGATLANSSDSATLETLVIEILR